MIKLTVIKLTLIFDYVISD